MNGRTPVALAALVAMISAQDPVATPPIVALRAFPDRVQLDDAGDRQQVLLLGKTASGIDVDVTAAATFTVVDAQRAQVVDDGPRKRLRPIGDGDTELVVVHQGLEVRLPVRVHGAGAQPPVSFANEVLPILTRAGCNAGSCHGAAAGKNGFGLSLFAYDPPRDHRTLTRALRSRRVDPAEPELSLMVQKAAGAVPHQGGKRLPAGSPDHQRVLAWIAEGATSDTASAPALLGIDVFPVEAVLVSGSRLPLLLRARHADGSDRDVTAVAIWSSSNDAVAAVDAGGSAQAKGGGESVVLARYGGFAVTARLISHREDREFVWPNVDERNFIDTEVHARLRQLRVVPAGICSDEVFVRRVFLDVIGLLPTPAEVAAFVGDPAAQKRERCIDALLQRPEFATAQAMAWAEVLRVDAERMEPKGALRLANWLQQQFAANRPFDEIARELLTSSGSSYSVPAASYWLAAEQPQQLAEHTAQVFLGVRMQCAQCHNHPFENWTMDDYYGFAAFFAQVGRKRGEDGAEWFLWDRRNGDVRNLKSGAVTPPRLLGGVVSKIPNGVDRRQVLADWLCSGDNAWFAHNVSNRVWARLFGRGIVDPPDDVRISNPPSHPELLRRLADLLVQRKFDLRALYAAVCNSRTYQLARHPDELPGQLFAGHHARRLSAEQLLDAIVAVTGVQIRVAGLSPGAPVTSLVGGRTGLRFLELFGRPTREGSCTCDRHDEPTLGQALHLIHGDTIEARLRDGSGRLQRWLADGRSHDAMLDELFLLAYARPPRDDERSRLLADVIAAQDAKAAQAAWADVFWAVLNSKEFLFQH